MTQVMVEHKSPEYAQTFSFAPIDLHNDTEVQILLEQRTICGWDNEMKDIERWRDQIARNVKWMWWITLPGFQTPSATNDKLNSNGSSSNTSTPTTTTKAGHVALAAECYPPDPDLANPDHSTLTVSSFFVLPAHRASGLGRACFHEMENKARQIPNCQWIAIDTIDRRYQFDAGPEWQGLLVKSGYEIKRGGLVNEDWYARMGYEKFKTGPRYPLAGTGERLVAVFMRKKVR